MNKRRKTTARVMYSSKLAFAIPLRYMNVGKNAVSGLYAAKPGPIWECPIPSFLLKPLILSHLCRKAWPERFGTPCAFTTATPLRQRGPRGTDLGRNRH